MRAILCSAFVCFSAAMTGCSTQYKLSPQPAAEQTKFINYGQDVIVSKKTNVVMVWPKNFYEESKDKLGLVVMVKNTSLRPTVIDPRNIRATFNGKQIATFTADEVLAEIQKKERTASIVAAIGGAFSAAGAASSGGRTYETGTVSGYTSSGRYVSGNYTANGYSSANAQNAVNAANAQTNANMADIRASASQESGKYSENRLRSNTIFPGDSYGGAIYFDAVVPSGSTPEKLNVEVQIDGETHSFTMDVLKI